MHAQNCQRINNYRINMSIYAKSNDSKYVGRLHNREWTWLISLFLCKRVVILVFDSEGTRFRGDSWLLRAGGKASSVEIDVIIKTIIFSLSLRKIIRVISPWHTDLAPPLVLSVSYMWSFYFSNKMLLYNIFNIFCWHLLSFSYYFSSDRGFQYFCRGKIN
jgi:hypothetical protein